MASIIIILLFLLCSLLLRLWSPASTIYTLDVSTGAPRHGLLHMQRPCYQPIELQPAGLSRLAQVSAKTAGLPPLPRRADWQQPILV